VDAKLRARHPEAAAAKMDDYGSPKGSSCRSRTDDHGRHPERESRRDRVNDHGGEQRFKPPQPGGRGYDGGVEGKAAGAASTTTTANCKHGHYRIRGPDHQLSVKTFCSFMREFPAPEGWPASLSRCWSTRFPGALSAFATWISVVMIWAWLPPLASSRDTITDFAILSDQRATSVTQLGEAFRAPPLGDG